MSNMAKSDIARSEFNIDENRIYMFGHSMGGAGTYYVAEKYPDIWAGLAVAAPAPFVSEDSLEKIKHIPILVIQGDQDGLVHSTRKWVAKMKELGMQHVYIEIPGADHSFAGNSSKVFSFEVPADVFEPGVTYTWQVKQRDEWTRLWSRNHRWSFKVKK